MALAGEVCIDRWEAHLVVRDAAGHPTEASPFARPVAGVRYEAASSPGVAPQGYVSRPEAAAACTNAGKRLCTAREWLRACEGPTKTAFPYGERLRAGACNTGKPHLMQKLFGADMRIYRFDAHYNSPKLNKYPDFLAKTGDHADCVSAEGVFDLVGNLHEWVSDPVDASFRKLLTERHTDFHVFETATNGNGAFMGGFYSTTDQYGTGCSYVTPAHEPAYHDYSTGFRCCRDAEGR
jgi:formylglycine-generating enzyme required for sulfatase activity